MTEMDYSAREEERFNNFYEDILSLHELLDQIQDISLRRQFRDIINKVEGLYTSFQTSKFQSHFILVLLLSLIIIIILTFWLF